MSNKTETAAELIEKNRIDGTPKGPHGSVCYPDYINIDYAYEALDLKVQECINKLVEKRKKYDLTPRDYDTEIKFAAYTEAINELKTIL